MSSTKDTASQQAFMTHPKPPLGLTPRHLVDEHRLADIDAALERYSRAGQAPPHEWLVERRSLCESLRQRRPSDVTPTQSEPKEPTDEDLRQFLRNQDRIRFEQESPFGAPDDGNRARAARVADIRAALARWGRLAIEPVPVSERLPGLEDCDAEGRCWAVAKYLPHGIEWTRAKATDKKHFTTFYRYWLPCHALPLPIK